MRNILRILCLLCLPALSLATPPTVTSTSGTVASGQTLTVNGSFLMDEDRTNWASSFTNNPNTSSFEGATPSADGYSAIGPSGGAYDTNVKLHGAKSIKFDTAGVHSSNLGDYNSIAGGTQDRWVRVYSRWNSVGGWPDGHIKMLQVPPIYFQPVQDFFGNLPFAMLSQGCTWNNQVGAIPDGQLQLGRWYAMEMHISTTITEYFIDGVPLQTRPGCAQPGGTFTSFGIINECCSTNPSFLLQNWMDMLAVSSTRIRPASVVELADGPVYSAAQKHFQPPVAISDTVVQVAIDMPIWTPTHVFITNSKGEVSPAFPLSGGGGPVTGRVAAYGFEEGTGATLGDVSGNSNNGAITGATWTTQGKYGKGLSFDGNDLVAVADSASLDLSTGYTIEAWVFPNQPLTTDSPAVVKEKSGGIVYNLAAHNGTAPMTKVTLASGSSTSAVGPSVLPINTWTHLAGTFDGTNVRLYVNGTQVAITPASGGIQTSTGPLNIGYNSIFSYFFKGVIDEVRVYDHALSASEIAVDMATPIVATGTPPGAIGTLLIEAN